MRVRVKFAKYGPMKFIGHLELMRYLQSAVRRTEIHEVHRASGIDEISAERRQAHRNSCQV